MGAVAAGRLGSVTVWPVKSMAGGTDVDAAVAARCGLAGDRAFAVVDRRPLRDGNVVSARSVPGLLRWTALPGPPGQPPDVVGPDGRTWAWRDPGLPGALSDDVGVPVGLTGPGSYADLPDSVLVTTAATHAGVETAFARPLDRRRWRTNLHLELSAPAFAEHAWEGRALVVGDVVLRLLHPCRRCTIPSWSPGGRDRLPELLRWFHRTSDGRFGINARVERPGTLRVGDGAEVR